MADAKTLTRAQLSVLVRLYRKHEDWARRSGYTSMDWSDFKQSRLANPLSSAYVTRGDRHG